MSAARMTQEKLTAIEVEICDRIAQSGSFSDPLSYIYAEMDSIKVDAPEDALRVYFYIIYALEHCIDTLTAKDKDREKLREMADKCLNFCGIPPVTSQLSHLYSRLYLAMSHYELIEGRPWDSVVEAMVAEYLGRDSRHAQDAEILLRAKQAWKLGHLHTVKVALHAFDHNGAAQKEEMFEGYRLLIRSYRLSGESEQAHNFCQIYGVEANDDPKWSLIFRFENTLCEMTRGADPKILADFVRDNGKQSDTLSLDTAKLWLFASRYRDLWKKVTRKRDPKNKKIKGVLSADVVVDRLLTSLETIYDLDLPFQNRLKALGEQLRNMHQIHDPEWKLLFLVSAIRWLNRCKQLTFASILIEEYKRLSLNFSEQKSNDTLSILDGLTDTLPVIVDRNAVRSNSKLFSGTIPRFIRMAKIVAKATLGYSNLFMQQLTADEFRKQQYLLYQEIIGDFEKSLSELKGPAMKIGQMLAASCFINEDAQHLLQRVYDNTNAVPLETMLQSLEADGGERYLERFAVFDREPIAVASIGQVYRAELSDGTPVAVKIMYPQVEKVIQSDLTMARLLKPVFRQFFNPVFIDQILDQYRLRFEAECDYRREASSQQKVYESFKDDPYVLVPRVYTEMSTEKALVSEFVEGVRLDVFIKNASQNERNHIATVLLQYMLRSALNHRLMHIDPHLANFIVSDNRLTVLDFGAVAEIPMDALQMFKRVLVSRYKGDAKDGYGAMLELEVFSPEYMNFETFQEKFANVFFSPFNDDRERLYFDEGQISFIQTLVRAGLTRKVKTDPRYFFIITVYSFLEEIIAVIEAHVNWRSILGEALLNVGWIDEEPSSTLSKAL